jgi:hypothetical protein
MTKRIVLCADDYGQAEAVSRGIIELLAARRLTAVSCLVNQPGLAGWARQLDPFQDQADIGLHLNFTEGSPLSTLYRERVGGSFQPLTKVLWRSIFRVPPWPRAALTAEIHAQLDAFTEAFGRQPQFIDGHQHVHHLPGIRAALLEVYEARLAGQSVYMRAVTQSGAIGGVKSRIIELTGGKKFVRLLRKHGVKHNTSFGGIYPFAQSANYRQYFQAFIRNAENNGLIMCHPGLASQDARDPIRQAREREFNYLMSSEFLADCQAAWVELGRFDACASG